ncbi:uncharacterized protein L969DRAFT_91376 [Mixia osmundae IAM 14324]|uniref:Myb-like domain-containing protein n=1 Tax=Mixia osmundae (strain CBS 9802 / IAM 14324 / JCM 22182 / KY 12970) TaxID=764103 RepID=G7E792_MIXOS|nr:uncharacterized protein L969DRAFT_91376 [Mixia osmundae IAM 14324]KEI41904.1 hypothetical protein L969DRAFT_91376 [Mixia osmundae IAM 14324]GAA98702.1 hypothetical protein E5Q_05390 [Mixia osmundae IAM 14324]
MSAYSSRPGVRKPKFFRPNIAAASALPTSQSSSESASRKPSQQAGIPSDRSGSQVPTSSTADGQPSSTQDAPARSQEPAASSLSEAPPARLPPTPEQTQQRASDAGNAIESDHESRARRIKTSGQAKTDAQQAAQTKADNGLLTPDATQESQRLQHELSSASQVDDRVAKATQVARMPETVNAAKPRAKRGQPISAPARPATAIAAPSPSIVRPASYAVARPNGRSADVAVGLQPPAAVAQSDTSHLLRLGSPADSRAPVSRGTTVNAEASTSGTAGSKTKPAPQRKRRPTPKKATADLTEQLVQHKRKVTAERAKASRKTTVAPPTADTNVAPMQQTSPEPIRTAADLEAVEALGNLRSGFGTLGTSAPSLVAQTTDQDDNPIASETSNLAANKRPLGPPEEWNAFMQEKVTAPAHDPDDNSMPPPAKRSKPQTGDIQVTATDGDEEAEAAYEEDAGPVFLEGQDKIDAAKTKMNMLLRDFDNGDKSQRYIEIKRAQQEAKQRRARHRQKMRRRNAGAAVSDNEDDEVDRALDEINRVSRSGTARSSREGTAATQASIDGDDEDFTMPAVGGPRLQIVDGQYAIDESSTQIRRAGLGRDDAEREVVTESANTRFVNSSTHSKRTGSAKWRSEENLAFFEALRMFGTDFEMIARLFPGRNRRMLKNKYTREEKDRPAMVNWALSNRIPIDIEMYELRTGVSLDRHGPLPEDPCEPYYEALPAHLRKQSSTPAVEVDGGLAVDPELDGTGPFADEEEAIAANIVADDSDEELPNIPGAMP